MNIENLMVKLIVTRKEHGNIRVSSSSCRSINRVNIIHGKDVELAFVFCGDDSECAMDRIEDVIFFLSMFDDSAMSIMIGDDVQHLDPLEETSVVLVKNEPDGAIQKFLYLLTEDDVDAGL